MKSPAVRRLFRRMHRLDQTQQLLGEKLVGVALWIVPISSPAQKPTSA